MYLFVVIIKRPHAKRPFLPKFYGTTIVSCLPILFHKINWANKRPEDNFSAMIPVEFPLNFFEAMTNSSELTNRIDQASLPVSFAIKAAANQFQ